MKFGHILDDAPDQSNPGRIDQERLTPLCNKREFILKQLRQNLKNVTDWSVVEVRAADAL